MYTDALTLTVLWRDGIFIGDGDVLAQQTIDLPGLADDGGVDWTLDDLYQAATSAPWEVLQQSDGFIVRVSAATFEQGGSGQTASIIIELLGDLGEDARSALVGGLGAYIVQQVQRAYRARRDPTPEKESLDDAGPKPG